MHNFEKKPNKLSKYSQFFAICKVHGFEYKDKVYEFTNGRTESLSSLSELEYTQMMKRLIDLNEPFRKNHRKTPGDKQRKKMMALAYLMNWGSALQVVKRLDGWARQQKFKKGWMQHNEAELDLLVAIFEQKVYTHYLTTLN